ncbi:MAG: aromatic amino acid lyase [Actinobacteria bacterium]|nr:aromatic amino acid lyase [Actinomycetota bacterium]
MADLAAGLLEGFALAPGEGLALLDNNAFSTGLAALATYDATTLLGAAELAGAASLDAFGASLDILDPEIGQARPLAGLLASLDRLREHLEGSRLWDRARARNLQDPLSFRTLPQVLGAGRDALVFSRALVTSELNASQGNPIVIAQEDRLASVGNFDGSSLAIALDLARIGLAPTLTVSAERTIKLLDTQWSGLTTGLAADPDGSSGLSIVAIASQSFATEARLLAQPVSFELASSSLAEGIEDRTSLAPLGARRLAEVVQLGSRVVAAELAVAARAAMLRDERPLGAGTERVIGLVRERAPGALQGTPATLDPLAEAVRSGAAS